MPANNGDVTVRVGADITDLQKGMKEAQTAVLGTQQKIQEIGMSMRDVAATVGKSTAEVAASMRSLSPEAMAMKKTMAEAMIAQAAGMQKFRDEQMAVKFGYFQMAQGAKTYTGTTADFVAGVEDMGKRHKKVTDSMLANNDLAKTSFLQTVGTVMARSTQSEKMVQNFDRMKNPIYQASNAALGLSNALEGVAKAGTPAVLALNQLGPTANMKQIQDHIKLINAGLMRFQMVALAGVIGAAMFYGALHNGAMQNAQYAASWNSMIANLQQAFKPVMDVFIAIMPHVFNFIGGVASLIAKFNEAHPVIAKMIGAFLLIIPALVAILAPLAVGIGMIGSLQAAFASVWMLIGPLITGLAAISGPVLIAAAAIALLGTAAYLLWKNWDVVIAYLKGLWTAFLGWASTLWNQLQLNLLTIWTAIKLTISAAVDAIHTVVMNVWNTMAAGITQLFVGIQQYLSGWWIVLKNIFLGAILLIVDLVTGNFDGMKTHALQIFGNIQGGLMLIWQGIQNMFGGALAAIWGLLSAGWNNAWTATKTFGSNLWTTITKMWSDAKQAIASGLSNAYQAVVSGWNNAMDFLRGINLYAIGVQIIDGLANGIRGAIGRVKSAVTDATSAITGKIKGILGIQSPSRYFRDEIGWNIGLGLAKGITQTRKMVAAATNSMALAAIPAVPVANMGASLANSRPSSSTPSVGDSGSLGGVTVQNMYVRNDQDIERIAQRLNDLQTRSLRAEGRV